jgi:hypothetical protein
VDALEATLLTKLNAERAAGGLAALAVQPWASSVARAHSQEMAGARDIWHNHTGYLDIARQAIGAYLTGENVAEAGTLDETDSLLMNSPPHRANILYPAFNYVGIGVALDAAGYVYVTQDFVTIRRAPAVVAAARTASPAAPAVAAAPRVAAATVPARLPAIAKPVPAGRAYTASHHRRPRRAWSGPSRWRHWTGYLVLFTHGSFDRRDQATKRLIAAGRPPGVHEPGHRRHPDTRPGEVDVRPGLPDRCRMANGAWSVCGGAHPRQGPA